MAWESMGKIGTAWISEFEIDHKIRSVDKTSHMILI